jgi:hypothetical protein
MKPPRFFIEPLHTTHGIAIVFWVIIRAKTGSIASRHPLLFPPIFYYTPFDIHFRYGIFLGAVIPTRYLSRAALHGLFKDLPWGMKRIWVNRNLRTLPDVYDRRMAREA